MPAKVRVNLKMLLSAPSGQMYLHQQHFDEKAAEEEQRNRNDGHPDGDLTLEARGDGVIGVEILAGKSSLLDADM